METVSGWKVDLWTRLPRARKSRRKFSKIGVSRPPPQGRSDGGAQGGTCPPNTKCGGHKWPCAPPISAKNWVKRAIFRGAGGAAKNFSRKSPILGIFGKCVPPPNIFDSLRPCSRGEQNRKVTNFGRRKSRKFWKVPIFGEKLIVHSFGGFWRKVIKISQFWQNRKVTKHSVTPFKLIPEDHPMENAAIKSWCRCFDPVFRS